MVDEAARFDDWVQNELSVLLGFPAGEELVNYILAFESIRELEEHFSNLLDGDDPKTKQFIDEFFRRWKPHSNTADNAQFYKKADFSSPSVRKKTKTKGKTEVKPKVEMFNADKTPNMIQSVKDNMLENIGLDIPEKMVVDVTGAEFLDKNMLYPEEKKSKSSSPFKKKHLKYVPLYSADGKLKTDTAMLPGRHACQCLAQKHKLINNCVECGRIVCEQEGSGPCMFCGTLVCSLEEQDIISRQSKKSKKLMEKLLNQTPAEEGEEAEDKALQTAIAHKERLLEYDKNCTKRTKVIDDEADYFTSDNRWMTKKQREALAKRDAELREKRFASRRHQKFTIDFAGRKVQQTVEDNYMYDAEDATVQSVTDIGTTQRGEVASANSLVDPRITIEPPKFNSNSFKGDVTNFLKAQQDAVKNSLRLQEMVDQGMCMSMHQPWASLLVQGIKKLEGRSWYTAHRGRLWIASTTKPADNETTKQVENQYRDFLFDRDIDFPKEYPCSALLGCVTVVDCASNEEYFKKHPNCNEESDSPYLFVCENPQQLKIKFSMKGKHKIYKLEPHIHAAARKSLMPS
ncbi:activating signal cointegrator 1-like [Hydractinia symbiolongicarpus]|uniref:activating signal cointegrator 1-like n=1 Tax=Hydractinia symbiolongicarpus TaxID=13093 RepID=UPI0025508A31|nr:activating signal cointegrator 1-like [Hydractinia symbiolongicarpus]